MNTKQQRTDAEVLEDILSNKDRIQSTLTDEDADVYLFLMKRFRAATGRISGDYLFQFVFRSYYRLDNAGLTKAFKTAYFGMMEDGYGANNLVDPSEICLKLAEHKNLRNQNTLQFSFATKLAATIDSGLPIYDLYVAKLFEFSPPGYGRSISKRLDVFMIFYARLKESILWLSQQQKYVEFLKEFNSTIKNWDQLSTVKQGDFILWAAGKAVAKKNGK